MSSCKPFNLVVLPCHRVQPYATPALATTTVLGPEDEDADTLRAALLPAWIERALQLLYR